LGISINSKGVFIIDRSFAVLHYDYENVFQSEFDLPFFSHSIFVDERLEMSFSNNTTDYEPLSYQVITLNKEGIINRAIKNEGEAISMYTSQSLSNNAPVHDNSLLFFKPWGTTIYEKDGSILSARYRLNTDNIVPLSILNNDSRLSVEQYKHVFLYNWPALETERFFLFRAISDHKLLTIIHHKIDNEFHAFKGLEDDILYGALSDFPLYSYGDKFYVPLNVEQLYAVKKDITRITDDNLLNELRLQRPEVFQLIDHVEELSNPIIMKCDLF